MRHVSWPKHVSLHTTANFSEITTQSAQSDNRLKLISDEMSRDIFICLFTQHYHSISFGHSSSKWISIIKWIETNQFRWKTNKWTKSMISISIKLHLKFELTTQKRRRNNESDDDNDVHEFEWIERIFRFSLCSFFFSFSFSGVGRKMQWYITFDKCIEI